MVDFSRLSKLQSKTCNDCGEEFTTHVPENTTCTECGYYREHPELAPMYWTWTRRGRWWTVAATWPVKEPLPEVGAVITVHRKDGTSSTETISEVDGLLYDMSGRARLHCWVSYNTGTGGPRDTPCLSKSTLPRTRDSSPSLTPSGPDDASRTRSQAIKYTWQEEAASPPNASPAENSGGSKESPPTE